MSDNPQEPREYDAVLGGENPPPDDGAVLGGIEGVKRRLASDVVEARISALRDALNYADAGLDLVIKALQDESPQIEDVAVELLSDREESKARFALLAYQIKIEPNNGHIYNKRALLRQELGDLQSAIADFSEAVYRLEYKAAEILYNRGLCRQQLGDFQGAIDDYDISILRNSKNINAYLNRGICWQSLKEYQKAKDNYLQVIFSKCDSVIVYYNLGVCSYNLKQANLAINYFSEAIEIDPNYPYSYIERAHINTRLENYQEAIEDYSFIIEGIYNQSLQALAYNYRGKIYKVLENYSHSIQDFTQAININPNYLDAYYNRGCCYFDLKDYFWAINDFTSAIEMNPQYIRAYNTRAEAYIALGEIVKAELDYQKVKELEG
ncbi:MAG: tetratricopeptide repeat protein [Rivularia sp. ALOHA_DT_140]|nr:tetratricopeptide repeat protein [Rivularia sp. ALOHA_DT_140]